MPNKSTIVYLLIGAAVIAFFIWQLFAYRAPVPAYEVLVADKSIQIRQYPELVIANVRVEGERYQSINDGFRILADYIFGDNSGKQNIAMTAPVMQTEDKNEWIVQFIMPSGMTKTNLPTPDDKRIFLTTLPPTKFIVIQFNGMATDRNLSAHAQHLKDYIAKHELKATGKIIYGFYNPPWILPFLRRNEIMMELQ